MTLDELTHSEITEMTPEELNHYGVRGMKWGVRKSSRVTSNDLKAKRRKAKDDDDEGEEHEDYKRTIERKSLKSMSTAEIKKINERLDAEKSFMEKTKREESVFEKKAKEVLTNVATNAATKFISEYANRGVDALIGKIDSSGKLPQFLKKAQDVKDHDSDILEKAKAKIAKRRENAEVDAKVKELEGQEETKSEQKTSTSKSTYKLSKVKLEGSNFINTLNRSLKERKKKKK